MATTKSAPAEPSPSRSRPAFSRPAFFAGVSTIAGMLLLAACTSTHGAVSPAGVASSAKAERGPYVALGDSYTSGPGIPDQVGVPAGCQRSSQNYPALVAQSLRLSADQVHDVSCGGATIADLSASQSTGSGTNAAQVSALSASTAVVTLGIGGNDIDFGSVLTRCTEMGLIPALIGGSAAELAPCQAYYTSGGVDRIQQKIQTAGSGLAGALREIERRAPHAHVYVVGYPALVPSGGAACAHALGITQGDVGFLHTEELKLNDMLRQHAEVAGATYVDTYTPSVGHDACSDAADRWIEPLLVASAAAPLHPNARGEQGMADAVEHAMATTS